MDFEWGFQSLWPSGTRSSALRVASASRSSSSRNISVIFMSAVSVQRRGSKLSAIDCRNRNRHCGQFQSSIHGTIQNMLQTSARLLRLLSLFQAQRYWSGADLSRRLDVTARTLRRGVDRLRSLGYPVPSTSGTAGGYPLGAGP